jgi:hypothetical protein
MSCQVAAKLPLLGGAGLELRAAAGWDPAVPTVWVAEGLTYYLEAASLKALIQVGWGRSSSVLQGSRKALV